MMKPGVRIKSDGATVHKSGDPLLLKVEVEKSMRGEVIGRESGLFLVPKVLDFDPERGVAVFEKIEDLIPFQRAYSFGEDYSQVADRLGRALAVIHRELTLPDDLVVPLPPPLKGPGRQVFLHGDFSVYNVCSAPGGRIIIIDWQMTRVHGGRATHGTPCFDLIWFINNLFFRPTLGHFPFRGPLSVADSFLKGYYREASSPPPPGDLSDYAFRFFDYKRPRRKSAATLRERPLLFISHRLAARFIKELQRKRLAK